MGLVKEGDAYTILTDIQGMEDALGDMDFKVAGTSEGITAVQMDIKVDGLSRDILASALAQAKRGRAFILSKMLECIAEPAKELSPYAPRVETITIPTEKIRDVIGTGGKVVRGITDETGVDIDIHEDGNIFITSNDAEGMAKAKAMIHDIVRDVRPDPAEQGRPVPHLAAREVPRRKGRGRRENWRPADRQSRRDRRERTHQPVAQGDAVMRLQMQFDFLEAFSWQTDIIV